MYAEIDMRKMLLLLLFVLTGCASGDYLYPYGYEANDRSNPDQQCPKGAVRQCDVWGANKFGNRGNAKYFNCQCVRW